MSASRSEGGISGDEWGPQGLSQCQVGCIIGSEVVAQLPDAQQEHIVGGAFEGEIRQILQGLPAAIRGERTADRVSSQDLRDFQINQVRGMQRLVGTEQAIRDPSGGRGVQQNLKEGRGVDDDRRRSRSARIACAGLIRGLTGVRSASRRRSSSGVSLSAARRASRIKYSDRGSPCRAARALRIRWRSSGTWRNWIILAM